VGASFAVAGDDPLDQLDLLLEEIRSDQDD
jgi:hypothetical protein